MKVYDVGGVSDAELIKTKPKTPAPVAPPLTAAEQRQVAQRLSDAHADLALWRACGRKACGRRRRCCGDVDECGALRSPRAWACVHEMLAAIRAGTAPRRGRARGRPTGEAGAPARFRFRPSAWIHQGEAAPTADGARSSRGSHRPQLTLQLRRLRAGSARWMRAVGQGALVSRPSERRRAMSRDLGAT